MEDARNGRSRHRRDPAARARRAGQVLWQRMRAQSRRKEAENTPRSQAPYETAYDVAHGYASERAIVEP